MVVGAGCRGRSRGHRGVAKRGRLGSRVEVVAHSKAANWGGFGWRFAVVAGRNSDDSGDSRVVEGGAVVFRWRKKTEELFMVG